MVSSPLVVMSVLAISVTVGYLSITNYKLRQETIQVVSVAERSTLNMDQSIGECKTRVEEAKARLVDSEKALKLALDNKEKVAAAIKNTQDDGQSAIKNADEVYERVSYELEEAELQIANLSETLTRLGGNPAIAEDGVSGAFSDATIDGSYITGDDN